MSGVEEVQQAQIKFVVRGLSPAMRNVINALAEVQEAEVEAVHVRTWRALRARDLVKATQFMPCCPVPLPTHWALTELGHKVADEIRRRS